MWGKGQGGDLPALPPHPPPNPQKRMVAQASSLCKNRQDACFPEKVQQRGPPARVGKRLVNAVKLTVGKQRITNQPQKGQGTISLPFFVRLLRVKLTKNSWGLK